jgi:hypothetical protein
MIHAPIQLIMHALIRKALAQRKESVRVILRCEAQEALVEARPSSLWIFVGQRTSR